MTDHIDMKKHEAAVDACLAKLKTFLMSPDHGDGDWPKIPREELTAADDLVGEMFDLKWGRDVDGDAPVRVRMWHRGQLRLVCDWAFIDTGPRGEESEAAQEARCLRNLSTVSAASAACADELRRLHVEMADAHSRKLRNQAAFEVVLVTYAPTAEWAAGQGRQDAPVSLHLDEGQAFAFLDETERAPGGFVPERRYRMLAMPPHNESPENGFAAYRARVEALCGKVVPRYATVQSLNLQHRRSLYATPA
ncbi:hypothetical protein DIE18_03030 [Burkholderia sp. Bp9125]|nr:hypothetical protein DIE18_03030 [Burkholderia sp. Bp9125]